MENKTVEVVEAPRCKHCNLEQQEWMVMWPHDSFRTCHAELDLQVDRLSSSHNGWLHLTRKHYVTRSRYLEGILRQYGISFKADQPPTKPEEKEAEPEQIDLFSEAAA